MGKTRSARIHTFGRVFSLTDVRIFQDIFIEWTKMVWEAAQGQVAVIDCKTVRQSGARRTRRTANPPIYMATANDVALGLEIRGCIATIDAMGCRKKTAREIVKKGADYVLAVKSKQPATVGRRSRRLEYGERTRFATMERYSFETVNKGAWARRAPPTLGRRPPRRSSDT